MRTRQRKAIVAILVGAVIAGWPIVIARATPQALAETVSEAMIPIRQAMNAAALGLHSVTPEDRHVNAQVLVNLLEGSQSDLFDESYGEIIDFPVGLLALLSPLSSSSQEAGDVAALAIEDYGKLLRLADEGVRAILTGDSGANASADAFLTAFVFLSRTYADFQGLLRDWEVEIWVRAGESIQSALDHAWTGATVRIEPGIYRETLEISKSVTLTGVGTGIVIEPVAEQDGIIIRAPEDARVHVSNLAVHGADSGIRVLGASGTRTCEGHPDRWALRGERDSRAHLGVRGSARLRQPRRGVSRRVGRRLRVRVLFPADQGHVRRAQRRTRHPRDPSRHPHRRRLHRDRQRRRRGPSHRAGDATDRWHGVLGKRRFRTPRHRR